MHTTSLFQKLTWRFNLLRKALYFPLEASWSDVLQEILSSHSPSYPPPLLLREEDDFGLYRVEDREVWFPLGFDPSFLTFVHNEIFVQRVYERGRCQILPGDWVVDAGACEGFFSLYALEKGANVLAFEPVLAIAQALEKTLKRYIEGGRAKVYALALASEHAEKEILISSANPGSNTIAQVLIEQHTERVEASRKERVITIPLDALLSSFDHPISFLKADVEGSERELLLGARETIRRYKPCLSICTYHLPDDYREILRIVRSFGVGYRVKFSGLFDHLYAW